MDFEKHPNADRAETLGGFFDVNGLIIALQEGTLQQLLTDTIRKGIPAPEEFKKNDPFDDGRLSATASIITGWLEAAYNVDLPDAVTHAKLHQALTSLGFDECELAAELMADAHARQEKPVRRKAAPRHGRGPKGGAR